MDPISRAYASDDGGGSQPRQYKRDPKGSSTGGQFTANPAATTSKPKPTPKPAPKPAPKTAPAKPTAKPASASVIKPPGQRPTGVMSKTGNNDPAQVQELQALLSALGLGNPGSSGTFDDATEVAVKAAQERLGLKPTGRASKALINKMLNAYDLSPCVKRSDDGDEYEVLRAALDGMEDDEDDAPAGGGTVQVIERADPDEPYGDVEYADPGYQSDGKKRYPLDSEEHCRAAWSYINQDDNAAKYTPEQLARIKGRIRRALERYDVETTGDDAARANDCCRSAGVHLYAREFPLDGIEILRSGDGRTVEAYAAIWDTPAEIRDQHGHYMETIDRSAFNAVLAQGVNRVGVFYHHGLTIHGTPSELGSVPIGSPVDIRVDGKGLRTITRYNDSDLADAVLSAIRNGDIKGYSFRGPIRRSDPRRIPKARAGMPLPTVTRMELGLHEYGPTPTPAYVGAGILAVRSVDQATRILTTIEDLRGQVSRMFSAAPPLDQAPEPAPPASGPGTEDQPEGPSGRFQQLQEELRALGVL